jgi:hypothetical protein
MSSMSTGYSREMHEMLFELFVKYAEVVTNYCISLFISILSCIDGGSDPKSRFCSHETQNLLRL